MTGSFDLSSFRLTKTIQALAVAALVAVPMISVVPQPVAAASAPDSFADLAERLSPAVVNVYTTATVTQQQSRNPLEEFQLPPGSPFEEFFRDFLPRQGRPQDRGQQQRRRQNSLGSGFIIDPAGFIVTNNHVIDGADEINVRLADNTELPAKLIGRDPRTDLALLKVESSRALPAVPWGDSDKMRVGDWVMAIGNPFGLGGTVTAGIVSARNRNIQAGPYDDFIQTDASINRGNSGGPMFNLKGEVVGVNSAIYSPNGGSVGIGFAISANLARPVIEQLKNGGAVKRGWIGVRIQSVTDELAEGFGLKKARGALIAGVDETGPAAKAQIRASDIILKFDGKEIADSTRLPRVVAETPIGKPVDVVVWRDGREQTLKLTVAELKDEPQVAARTAAPPAAASAAIKALGLQLGTLDDKAKERFGLTGDPKGVLVTEVDPNGPAAEKGVRPGDLIVEINQEPVRNADDVAARIKAARDGGKKTVLLMLDQKGDTRFAAVRIDG